MSLLPERKKSAEEIARLRETLGVPPAAAPEPSAAIPQASAAADTLVPHVHQADLVHTSPPAALSPLPAAAAPGAKPVHSFKRSERDPLSRHAAAGPAAPVQAPSVSQAEPPPPTDPKPIRSLRKSEQSPPARTPVRDDSAGDGRIPFRRHSDEELHEIRRREAIALLNIPPPDPRLLPAHPAAIAPGYVLAFSGASCFLFEDFPLAATAGCAAAALLVALAILLRRPISRHHSAFIFIIALFVIVFGALHYFPQLRHAT